MEKRQTPFKEKEASAKDNCIYHNIKVSVPTLNKLIISGTVFLTVLVIVLAIVCGAADMCVSETLSPLERGCLIP